MVPCHEERPYCCVAPGASLTLKDLTLVNGQATGTTVAGTTRNLEFDGGPVTLGGGILQQGGSVTLTTFLESTDHEPTHVISRSARRTN
jgi:hypothetical protein